ncbi:MAG: tetratricopeptide repeat protein [Candidatus Hinthialibacter antarcticus]|nr:tetratricopeptide repeat protein [Candidatus Hinthialibacter antarcticus]
MAPDQTNQPFLKWAVIFNILLLLICASCSPSQQNASAVDVTTLVKAGQYDEASEIISKALSENPRNVDLLYNFALIQRLTGDYTEARRNAVRALELSPGDDDVLLLLAELGILESQAKPAWDRLNQMSASARNRPRALYLSSMIQMQMSSLDEAEGSLRKAISLGDVSPLTKAMLAYIKIQKGQIEEGKAYLAESESASEKSDDAIRQIAECHLELGQAQNALTMAKQLSPETKRDANLWALIGRAQLTVLDFGEAESAFTRALVCPNTSPWHRAQYAEMLFAAQREDEALTQAQSAEEGLLTSGTPIQDPSLYNLLATLYARKDQMLPAHKYLQLSLSIAPNQPKVKELLKYFIQGSAPSHDEIPSVTPEP